MTTAESVEELINEELMEKPVDTELDRILGDHDSTVDELVAHVADVAAPAATPDPEPEPTEPQAVSASAPMALEVTDTDHDPPALMIPSLALGLAGATAVAFTPWIPQAVMAGVLVACACFLTQRLCLRAGLSRLDRMTAAVARRLADPRGQECLEASLKELEKLRVFFESLFEKHVFRINEELRETEAELERLEEELRNAEPMTEGELESDDETRMEDPAPASCETVSAEARQGENLAPESLCGRSGELQRLLCDEMEPRVVSVEVRELIKGLADGFREEARSKGVKLSCRVASDLGDLQVDPVALSRIVDELLSNAVTHTRSQGAISMSTTLRDGDDEHDYRLRINLKDTGKGISQKAQEGLFDPPDLGPDTPETGLGLPLAAAYAELLGGSVWVESQLREGSTFTVEIPVNLD